MTKFRKFRKSVNFREPGEPAVKDMIEAWSRHGQHSQGQLTLICTQGAREHPLSFETEMTMVNSLKGIALRILRESYCCESTEFQCVASRPS